MFYKLRKIFTDLQTDCWRDLPGRNSSSSPRRRDLFFRNTHIHQRTAITEGGVIGMMLLIERWIGLSPAVITPILDITCYVLALSTLEEDSSGFPYCPL